MPRLPLLSPSALLASAVRHRTAGSLEKERRALFECLEAARKQPEGQVSRTARFYLALSGCQTGNFAAADEQLSRLGLGARLSDAVWMEDCSKRLPESFFVHVADDGLPQELVEALRKALGHDAEYWAAHDYHSGDLEFFSHAHRLGEETHLIDQLIEALRPMLAEVAPDVAKEARLAEWWAHRRERGQWHGHPLHFDTHERLLRQSGGETVIHPDVSTVVYLSDDSQRFGPTLVTSQLARRENKEEAAALVRPKKGRVLFFDGGYLHGALPGRPWLQGEEEPDWRLCIMVGWWTRPMEPMPPSRPPEPVMLTEEGAKWVRSMGRLESWKAGRARWREVKAAGGIWKDVATTHRGEAFSGRFFLAHRGQVDEDLFS